MIKYAYAIFIKPKNEDISKSIMYSELRVPFWVLVSTGVARVGTGGMNRSWDFSISEVKIVEGTPIVV